MSNLSSAIGSERLSRVAGYKIKKGFFDNNTPNLKQVVAVFGEANTANQGGLSIVKKEITSAKEAGELYGFGSPIHQQMRILRPSGSDGIGGIPTMVFPQASDGAAVATENVWTISGVATENKDHSFVINGRRGLDFEDYSYTIVTGDTAEIVANKISDAINGVPSSPVTASVVGAVITLTTKWAGATSAELNTRVDNGGDSVGMSYTLTTVNAGAGSVDLADTLEQFTNEWYTTVLNPYGASNTSILKNLEDFNGFPDDETPTGRYQGRIFMPFVALCGTTLDDKDDLAAITDADARVNQVTNVVCVAPKSEGFSCEASANACIIYARIAQDSPELDVDGKRYPDMPTPDDSVIGDMSDYNNRDFLVKKGCSTVILENGAFIIQDFVTTYHPSGETPLQYSYVRNLNIDFNVKDGYTILEKRNVRDHVLVRDGQVTDAPKSVKPKQFKAVIFDYFDDLAIAALINEPDFSKESLKVEINATNQNRFDVFFRYKRTGTAKIVSTDAEAGF